MISSEAAAVLSRLRGQGSDFDFLADVLQDFGAAILASAQKQEPPDEDVNTLVFPPDKPNLQYDDAPGVQVGSRFSFMNPGDTGAQGGFTYRFRGPTNFTPNKDEDVTIFTPDGTIVCDRLILGGVEVIIQDC